MFSLINNLTKENIANFLILLIPVTYIAGNLLLNLNIFILIIFIIAAYRQKVFQIKMSILDKLILIFFVYLIANGVINNFFNFNYPDAPKQNIILSKSLFFIRFILLYFVVRFLISEEIINFRMLFFVFGICSLIVSLDILIQLYFGKNLLGFEGSGRRLAGLFGDEYIAGSFIQRFFIFLIFFILIFTKIEKNKILFNFLISLIIFLSLLGVLFSGNRIPLILCFLILTLIFIYQKSLRRIIIFLFLFFISSTFYLISVNSNISHHIKTFKIRGEQTLDYIVGRVITNEIKIPDTENVYIKEFESGVLTWQENKYFGGGIKSFYWHCNNIDRNKMLKFVTETGPVNCNSHPHNYYLQIAAELGLVGIVFIFFLFSIIMVKTFRIIHFSKYPNKYKMLIVPFFVVFIAEIFPLKTTGSFFTSTNSTFLFIIIAFIVGLLETTNINKKL